jgi:hypothetical protein
MRDPDGRGLGRDLAPDLVMAGLDPAIHVPVSGSLK